tara:strand:+ start:5796 stop:8495 length:2700 start_codon:yes stop_codon:yes gene_type:complete
MVEVEIDGIGVVELDDSFTELSKEDQQKTINEISAKVGTRKSSDLAKASAYAKGFNVGSLSDVLGFPVDLVNTGLGVVGLGSETPFGGSESIRRALTAGGMGYMDEQDLPKDQRALARGGRTTGQVVGSAAPIFGAARRLTPAQALMQPTPSKSATIVPEIVRKTARSPGQMATMEGASAVGAGQARMIAEDVAPGNELVGTLSEVAGGVLSPVALAAKPMEMGKQFLNRFSEAGRERAAASKTLEILRQQNPNITDDQISGIAKQLRDAEGPGRTAQVTQDELARKTFTAMDNKLIADASDEAKTAIQNQNKKTIEAFNRKIRKMQNSGNPEMVKEAARLRLETFTKQMNKRVDDAESKAGEAVARVLNKNSDDAVGASREARKIIDDELTKARAKETQLWGEVDKSVPSPTKKTIEAFNSIKDEISPNEQVMKPLEGFIQGLIKRKDSTLQQRPGRGFIATAQRQGFQPVVRVSAKELFRKRSVALNLARQAKATGRFNDARILNKLANGMLEDLNQVTDASANVAREFSRSLNERFNTKLIKNIRDAEPEVALETGIRGLGQGSDTQRALNIQAMKRATESTEASEVLAREQKSFIQSSAARIIDPQTGQVDTRKLANLIKENPQTLREVGLLDDVSNMNQQVRLADILRKTAKQGQAFAQQRSVAGQILDEGKKGGLRNVVENAFNSKYQAEAFRDLNNMVRRAKNPQAVEGLQHEIFDALLSKATIKGGELDGLISGKQLEDLLNSKVGEKTLRQNLLSSKLFTPNQMTAVAQIARKARIFEEVVKDPAKLDDIIKTGDGVLNLFARVVGSKLGANSFLGQMMGGTTLIAQSAFSKIAQKTIEKVPALKVQGVLTKAMQDPKFMAMLLEMGPKASIQTQRRINAYLLQAGLLED